MKQGWEVKCFENCFKLKSGDNLTSKNMSENGSYPVFGGNGIVGYHNEFNLSGSNIIIGRVGALCGNVRHIIENIWLTDNAFKIVDFKFDFDHSFLTYLLNYKDLRSYARQAAQPVISNSSLKDVVLQFPKSLKEQQRIVSILDEAFAAIDKAKANAEQNLKNAKELFESYLQGVFEKKGDGWDEKKLGEVCDIKHGYAFEGDDFETDYSGSNPIVLTPGNFTEDCKLSFTTKNTKRCKVQYPNDYLFSVGELVVVMTDLSSLMKILGKPAVIVRDDILHNQRIGRFIFKEKLIEKNYLFYFLQTNKYLNKVKESATGTMVRHTAPKRILNIELQFPKSLKEQQTIVRQLDALRAETKRLEAIYQQKLLNLEELKKSVLQKAFAGELN